MPKYDAFGREIGEDTLSGLGGDAGAGATAAPAGDWTDAQVAEAASSGATAAPETPPAPAPPKPSFQLPAGGSVIVRRRRGSGLGCLVSLVVLIAIIAVPVVALVSFVGDAGDTIDDITGVLDSGPDADTINPEPAAPGEPAKPPSGLTGASMVAPANFGKALKRFDGLGRVTFIRLSPDRVDAQLVKGSRQRSAQVDYQGGFARSPAIVGASNVSTVALSGIDRSAPARLVRGSAARFSVRERGINYLVLSPWPGEGPRWVAYFKNGVYVQGDGHGKVVRKISGP